MASILPQPVVTRQLGYGMPQMDITCLLILVILISCAQSPGLQITDVLPRLPLIKLSRFGKCNEYNFSLLFFTHHKYRFTSNFTLYQIIQRICYMLQWISSRDMWLQFALSNPCDQFADIF